VVGCGNIGKNVVLRAAAFGMRILICDIKEVNRGFLARFNAEQVPLEELLRRSDYVTLHTDLNASSRHMLNAETIRLMKPTAVLINCSRGPCVNEVDLAEALKAKVMTLWWFNWAFLHTKTSVYLV
jgi:phosphoglycerate dehydrogenase-like enzyme